MLLDPRNGPDWDLPTPSVPTRTYVIASLPRTGSTLLSHLLWDTGRVGAPKEYLNPMQIRDWESRLAPTAAGRLFHSALRGPAVNVLAGRGRWDRPRIERYLRRVRERRTGDSGWFGLKIHWHHFERWFLSRGLDPEELLGPIRWIALTRDDHVAQAVSWARAMQTGRWASWQSDQLPPIYDPRRIAARLDDIEAGEAGWKAWFEARGVQPLSLTFEQVVADKERAVRAALTWLDDPEAERVPIPPPPLRRQSDGISAAWSARFKASRFGRARQGA
jgi:LPS sulfotransferase NodH